MYNHLFYILTYIFTSVNILFVLLYQKSNETEIKNVDDKQTVSHKV